MLFVSSVCAAMIAKFFRIYLRMARRDWMETADCPAGFRRTQPGKLRNSGGMEWRLALHEPKYCHEHRLVQQIDKQAVPPDKT